MGLVSELRRRNVFRMAALYVIAAWLIMQIAEVVIALAALPTWIGQATLITLALALPIVLVFSWLFEVTPKGIALEKKVPEGHSITHITGRRIDFIAIALLTAALALFAHDKWWSPAHELSIAVLPFENLSDDPQQEYFVHGMHNELLTRLSKIGALKVISRTSVMPYRATKKTIPQIADELSVANVVEGSVQLSGDLVHINAQLINARTDEHLWADTFCAELTTEGLIEVQSEIAKSIADALHAKLTPTEERGLKRKPTEDLTAYDAYLNGFSKQDNRSVNDDLREAVALFSKATELDPDFALAWAGICEAKLALYMRTSDRQYFDAAESACIRSIELDDSRPEVHVAAALLYSVRGQYSQAEVALRQADFARSNQMLENAGDLDRISILTQLDLAYVYARQGRISEAEITFKRAAESDPRNWKVHSSLFNFYYSFSDLPNRFELAANHAAIAAALHPGSAVNWNNLGTANYMMGNYEEAADAWMQAATIEPNRTSYTNTGISLFHAKKFAESAGMQRRAIEIAPNDHRVWGRLGNALSYIEGEEDQAAAAYENAANLARGELAVNDRSWRTWSMLASYLANIDPQEAAAAAERGLELSKRNSESLFWAASVYHEAGREIDYLDLLEELIAKDPAYQQFLKTEVDCGLLQDRPRCNALLTD